MTLPSLVVNRTSASPVSCRTSLEVHVPECGTPTMTNTSSLPGTVTLHGELSMNEALRGSRLPWAAS